MSRNGKIISSVSEQAFTMLDATIRIFHANIKVQLQWKGFLVLHVLGKRLYDEPRALDLNRKAPQLNSIEFRKDESQKWCFWYPTTLSVFVLLLYKHLDDGVSPPDILQPSYLKPYLLVSKYIRTNKARTRGYVYNFSFAVAHRTPAPSHSGSDMNFSLDEQGSSGGRAIAVNETVGRWHAQPSNDSSSASFDMDKELEFGEPGELIFGEDLEETSTSARYWHKMQIAEEAKRVRSEKRRLSLGGGHSGQCGDPSPALDVVSPRPSITWSEVTPLSQNSSVNSYLVRKTIGFSRGTSNLPLCRDSLRRSSREIDLLGASVPLNPTSETRILIPGLVQNDAGVEPKPSTASADDMVAVLSSRAPEERRKDIEANIPERSNSSGRRNGLFWRKGAPQTINRGMVALGEPSRRWDRAEVERQQAQRNLSSLRRIRSPSLDVAFGRKTSSEESSAREKRTYGSTAKRR